MGGERGRVEVTILVIMDARLFIRFVQCLDIIRYICIRESIRSSFIQLTGNKGTIKLNDLETIFLPLV